MAEKVVLIGAGSAMFLRGLVADLLRCGWSDAELALVDTDPEALATAEGLTRKMSAAKGSRIRVSASTDRRGVLAGATVVICTIGVGGRRAWELDVQIPRRHGIHQPVGDSVGAGGTSRALRMIPAMVAIAEDVLELAPRALFFNYGNPMAPVCRAVRKATGADMIGLCHGVNHVADHLARILDTTAQRLDYAACGMNHLTWFTEVRVDGVDAMPRLRRHARALIAARDGGRVAPVVDGDDYASWSLFDLFGAFPAVLDRHICEFFPQLFSREGAYYGRTVGADAMSFERTIRWGDEAYAAMRAEVASDRPLPDDYFDRIGGEHEQVLEIIASIRRDDGRIYSANLPNRGQIPNLPADAVVEAPARARAGGLQPIAQKPLASGVQGTLATRFAWVETTVEAALEGSRDKVVQALIIDGSAPSIETARALADELIAAQAAHLPRFAVPKATGIAS
ncbi:MAG TPA: hypothetical protein VEL07_02600 [Planctomycetota bacterium]|nr:hypothetical protein [Planctomycetota bacterium]